MNYRGKENKNTRYISKNANVIALSLGQPIIDMSAPEDTASMTECHLQQDGERANSEQISSIAHLHEGFGARFGNGTQVINHLLTQVFDVFE